MALSCSSKTLASVILVASLAVTPALPVMAQGQARPAAAAQSRSATPASLWTVDRQRSRLVFRATAAGAAFNGRIEQWIPTIRFDPRNLAGSSIAVDVAVSSIKTGDAERDGYLPSKDWFDTARHPRARYVSNQIRSLGGNRYEAVGNLTIRGVTRPLNLPFTVDITNNQATAKGSIGLNRNAFGIGSGQWTGEDTVGRAVNISFEIKALKAS